MHTGYYKSLQRLRKKALLNNEPKETTPTGKGVMARSFRDKMSSTPQNNSSPSPHQFVLDFIKDMHDFRATLKQEKEMGDK